MKNKYVIEVSDLTLQTVDEIEQLCKKHDDHEDDKYDVLETRTGPKYFRLDVADTIEAEDYRELRRYVDTFLKLLAKDLNDATN